VHRATLTFLRLLGGSLLFQGFRGFLFLFPLLIHALAHGYVLLEGVSGITVVVCGSASPRLREARSCCFASFRFFCASSRRFLSCLKFGGLANSLSLLKDRRDLHFPV